MALQSVIALGSVASQGISAQRTAAQEAENRRVQELDKELRLSNKKRDHGRALQQSLATQNNRAAARGTKADEGSALLVSESLANEQLEELQSLDAKAELNASRSASSTGGGSFNSARSLLNLWDYVA